MDIFNYNRSIVIPRSSRLSTEQYSINSHYLHIPAENVITITFVAIEMYSTFIVVVFRKNRMSSSHPSSGKTFCLVSLSESFIALLSSTSFFSSADCLRREMKLKIVNSFFKTL